MTNLIHSVASAASPRREPTTGFAACVRPFGVVTQSKGAIGMLGAIGQLGHESSDCGHNAHLQQGVFRGSLSM